MNTLEGNALSQLAAGNMRRLRKDRDWSVPDLARATGLSKAMIAAIEAGRRNFTFSGLAAAAQALEVDPADLIGPGSGRAPSMNVYVPPGVPLITVTDAAARKLGFMLAE